MSEAGKITQAAVDFSVTMRVPPEARDYKPEGGGTSMVQALAIRPDRMAGVLLEFEERVSAVESNQRLSDVGRAEKMVELFEQYHGRLDFRDLAECVVLAEKELERLQHVADPPAADDPNGIHLASDIRKHVAGLSREDREKFLNQNAADPQVASALLSAPPYLSGMSQLHLDVFRKKALAALHPHRAERIALLERTKDAAMTARNNAERMLTARARVRYDRRSDKWVAEPTRPLAVPRGVGGPPVRKHRII